MSTPELIPTGSFETPIDDQRVLEQLPQVFLDDFYVARDLNVQFFKRVLEPTQPEDGLMYRNADKNIFFSDLSASLVLKNMGYGIHLSDDPMIFNNPSEDAPDLVRISIIAEDFQAVDSFFSVLHRVNRRESNSYLRLTKMIDGFDVGIFSFSLNPLHASYREAMYNLRGLPEAERLPILYRGFLTALLSNTIEQSNLFYGLSYNLLELNDHHGSSRPFSDAPDYEKLRQQGVKPFSPEELLGISSSIIQQIIEKNPTISKPLSKR
jgi:hypothetical protein